MSEKTIYFRDKKISKKDFYNNKKQFNLNDIDTNKILISKPESYGKNNVKKYIIGYNDNPIKPIQLFLPKMTGYLNIFEDGNSKMSFLTNNNEFLEKCITIWEKISNLINKNFDSDPVYKDKYTNTKIRYTKMILLQIFVILIIKIINNQKKTNCISAYIYFLIGIHSMHG